MIAVNDSRPRTFEATLQRQARYLRDDGPYSPPWTGQGVCFACTLHVHEPNEKNPATDFSINFFSIFSPQAHAQLRPARVVGRGQQSERAVSAFDYRERDWILGDEHRAFSFLFFKEPWRQF
jgi:hypothetical protein